MNDSKAGRWRLNVLCGLLAAGLLAIAGRVLYIQTHAAELALWAEHQRLSVVTVPGRPGDIFGKSTGGYVVMAGSKQAPCCYADPGLLADDEIPEVAQKVAQAAGTDSQAILKELNDRRDRRYAVLLRDLTDEQAQAIRKLDLKAVQISYEWKRQYPLGSLGSQVLGYRQIDGVGAEGLEAKGDRLIAGKPGKKILQTDAARRGIYAQLQEFDPPTDGKHLVLTLDVNIQGFLEQSLAEAGEKWGAQAVMGVVMDPNNGSILGMASWPTYDPNNYSLARPEERKNRCLTDPFEPGSVFKSFIATGAVQMHKATWKSQFFCHYGCYDAPGGGTIRDFPGEHFGVLPLLDIVVHSSNIGMAKLGETLGERNLYEIAKAFGFGKETGIELPGESGGTLLPPSRWDRGYSLRRVPFGQGPISVTTLQLVTAYSAIANGGVLYRPRVVDCVLDTDGKVLWENRPHPVRRVLDAAVSRSAVEDVLAQVVERGTAKRCRLDKWTIFGKTGTAQIGGPGGYKDRAYTGTFVGGGPVGSPAVMCGISVYHPDYAKGHAGGVVAAPFVRDVLARTLTYLDVPPDRDYQTPQSGVATAGGEVDAE
jgi:cell division protein FtsI (penicillin-binding protein 3)